jgi:alkyldihydroxyacetonephosphate synthase
LSAPTPFEGGAEAARERFACSRVAAPERLLDLVRASGATVELGMAARAESGRDWWPIAIGWAAAGEVPARPAAVVTPTSAAQVAAILAACSADRVPVTAAGGRSGVCGGAVPLFGGLALDSRGLVGEIEVDDASLVANVPAGVNGRVLEERLRATGAGYTLGHWPQSIDLSTVGGWLACRSAGQYSTRYGKIEDMVVALEVALADGRLVRTAPVAPRAAAGPNLTQLFVGSEGMLGVITRAWLRIHPLPLAEGRRAFSWPSFGEGLDACRRILRRGATPAVLRLYDHLESERSFSHTEGCVLVVLDEADAGLLAATLAIVDDECGSAERLDDGLVAHWLSTRNDVSALAPLWRAGIVVDTAEVAGPWVSLPALADDVCTRLRALDGTLAASAHLSHAYLEGACLYFTFAGRATASTAPTASTASTEQYYRRAWDAVIDVTLAHDAAISHHHGIGINRARFLPRALGDAHDVLVSLKGVLDPAGILNPGKLGIPSSFGEACWP